jgi:uncharacterized membrane protein YkgB
MRRIGSRADFGSRLERMDETLVRLMSAYGIHLLRWAIAVLYLWFGSLKLIHASPAAELVVGTVFWLPPRAALVFIGSWEMLIGAGLLCTHPLALRATLFLLWLQIAGTFQVFFLLPEVAFQNGNPLLPTLEGQYAVKNLVLVAAGLVIGSTVRRNTEEKEQAKARAKAKRPPLSRGVEGGL